MSANTPEITPLAHTLAQFGIWELVANWPEPVEDAFQNLTGYARVRSPQGLESTVQAFVSSQDGSQARVRYLPREAGTYHWTATFQTPDGSAEADGSFMVEESDHRGIVEVDGWAFRWSNSQQPFFFNSTTAYMMAGLSDERIEQALNRLADKGVTRIRVSLCPSRQADGGRWQEPQVGHRDDFTYLYGPWPAHSPASVTEPDFDTSRFQIDYWEKYERLLSLARARNILVQVIFFTDAQEPQNYPFDRELIFEDPAEIAYYQYAINRLAAFSNVEWCITNEWALFRPDEWVEKVGSFIAANDPYHHLLSVHGHGHFPFRASTWCTHALFQVWDEDGGYDWMLEKRSEQLATGTIKPQVNEEYGYEDHYPVPWGGGKVAPARSADNRRRLAWEITMAGGHQTTGESAANGLGGWINGLGDDSMTLLAGHRHLSTFFATYPLQSFEPWAQSDDRFRTLRSAEGPWIVYSRFGDRVPDEWRSQVSVMRTFDPLTGQWDGQPHGGDWVSVLLP